MFHTLLYKTNHIVRSSEWRDKILSSAYVWWDFFSMPQVASQSKTDAQESIAAYIYMGPNRMELVKYLISKGAKVDSVTYNGTSHLISASSSEDSDPRVVKFLIEKLNREEINRQIRAQTSKWSAIYSIAKLAHGSGLSRHSVLVQCLSERLGRTALHYAIRRGDYKCVQMLLKNGADISIKDSSGQSAKDLCAKFVELKDLLRSNDVLTLQTKKNDSNKAECTPPTPLERRMTKTAEFEFFG